MTMLKLRTEHGSKQLYYSYCSNTIDKSGVWLIYGKTDTNTKPDSDESK